MPHSQGLSNNTYPEPNQPNSPHFLKAEKTPEKLKLETSEGPATRPDIASNGVPFRHMRSVATHNMS